MRVEIPAHTDDWMRGDRYGDVVKISGRRATVRLDKSGRTRRYPAGECRIVAR